MVHNMNTTKNTGHHLSKGRCVVISPSGCQHLPLGPRNTRPAASSRLLYTLALWDPQYYQGRPVLTAPLHTGTLGATVSPGQHRPHGSLTHWHSGSLRITRAAASSQLLSTQAIWELQGRSSQLCSLHEVVLLDTDF